MLTNLIGIDKQAGMSGFILNVNPALEKILQFNQGEILKGVVQEIKADGIISLIIKGKLVNAASEVKVDPGQQLYLLADGFEGNMPRLKLITTGGAAEPDDANLSAGLRSLGVSPDSDALLVARKLLEHDLPVTRQIVEEIFKAIDTIGGVTTRNIESAVFAVEHGIPFDKNIFPLINQFISADGDLSNLVKELIQLLARMEAVPRSDSPASAAPSVVITSGSVDPPNAPPVEVAPGSSSPPGAAGLNLAETGGEPASIPDAVPGTAGNDGNAALSGDKANVSRQSVSPQGNAAPFLIAEDSPAVRIAVNPDAAASSNAVVPGAETAGGGAGQTNAPLIVLNPAANSAAETAGEAGTATPPGAGTALNNAAVLAAIAANPIPAGGADRQPPAGLDPAASGGNAATRQAASFDFIELAKILRSLLDSAVGKITGSGHGVNPVLQDLVRDRAGLLDNLRGLLEIARADEMLAKTQTGQELLAKISSLQQQITGQALFNSAVKLDQDVFTNSYYFSFPVEIDKQLTYCQLRIQKNTSNRLDQQDNIKLVVSLDTPALGIVIFHIDWYRQGYIQLEGVTETDEAGNFIKKNIAELLLNLDQLGYKTGNLGVKTAKKPEELILKPLIKEAEQGKISQFSVDIII